ncbi:MAG: diphosphomevalonate decarboxylase [Bacteroidota bacterium]
MLDKKFRDEIVKTRKEDISDIPRTVAWESPSNVALVKYWGKKDEQIPLNPSLSLTLSNLHTRTEIHYRKSKHETSKVFFRFGNNDEHPFGKRVKKYLKKTEKYFPFLAYMDLYIESNNNFPHSSGLASSASAYSSIALCLCSIEDDLRREEYSSERFFQKASYIARLGSGSACRSVYGNLVEWGEHDYGSNEFANPFGHRIHKIYETLQDSILLVSSKEKKITSSEGHKKMHNHPFREARKEQAVKNLDKIRIAIKEGNFTKFANIVENEALTLHSLMLSSNPGFLLMEESTIEIIEKVRKQRKENKLPVTFTLDAGPNVHLIYPLEAKEEVRNFINNELTGYCEHGQVIHDFTGPGPHRTDGKG